MSDIAKEIRDIRKKIGLSARSFAKVIGSNVCSVYNFENGRSKPQNPSIMKRIRNIYTFFIELGNDPDYLEKMREKYEKDSDCSEELIKEIAETVTLAENEKISKLDVINMLKRIIDKK